MCTLWVSNCVSATSSRLVPSDGLFRRSISTFWRSRRMSWETITVRIFLHSWGAMSNCTNNRRNASRVCCKRKCNRFVTKYWKSFRGLSNIEKIKQKQEGSVKWCKNGRTSQKVSGISIEGAGLLSVRRNRTTLPRNCLLCCPWTASLVS